MKIRAASYHKNAGYVNATRPESFDSLFASAPAVVANRYSSVCRDARVSESV